MIRHAARRAVARRARGVLRVPLRRSLHEGRSVLDVSLGKHDHVIQVFGANTDVGKTVITAGLLRAAAFQGYRASYIKPVQAGSPSDASFVSHHANGAGGPATGDDAGAATPPRLHHVSTLYDYTDPVSPHLAAERDGGHIASDTDIVEAIVEEVRCIFGSAGGDRAAGSGGARPVSPPPSPSTPGNLVLVEAAGGVLSPAPSGSLQADAFRPMRLPVLLVGDGKLGGIGATLSALESLRTRGYSVLGIALFAQDEHLGNAEALSRHAAPIPVHELPALPPPELPLEPWYREEAIVRGFQGLLGGLAERRAAGAEELAGMKARGRKALWWPFTQHDDLTDGKVNLLDSAYGDYFCVADARVEEAGEGAAGGGGDGEDRGQVRVSHRALVDACASWWTQGAGHGNPGMALAVAEAAGRYGHVIFPGNIHAPALEVAERLVEGPGKGWASRVFFTDNGSTATEVGIKMGFRRFLQDRFALSTPPSGTRLSVVAQEGCYHGDTLGAMNVAVPSVFNQGQHAWYQAQGLFFETPNVSWRDGCFNVALPRSMHEAAMAKAAEVELGSELMLSSRDAAFEFVGKRDDGALADVYRQHVRSKMDAFEAEDGALLGSLLLEPLVMGAGGMVFVDPLFQRVLVQECRARGLPVIYDEVFSGLWRLGVESTKDLLQEDPDVSCYAKLLTGGLVPMAATVATERVFDAFSGAKADSLLHGHSYTAHPVGCAAAVEFLSQLEKSAVYPGAGGRMSDSWDEGAIRELSKLPNVDRAFALGSVLAVEMKAAQRGYDSQGAAEVVQRLHDAGVYARVLGNVAYVMVSPTTPTEACEGLMSTLMGVVQGVLPGEDGRRRTAREPDDVAYSI